MRAADQKKVLDVIAEQLFRPAEEIQLDKPFYEQGGDSLDLVEIVILLEDVFEIEILDEDIIHVATPNDLLAFIEKRRPA